MPDDVLTIQAGALSEFAGREQAAMAAVRAGRCPRGHGPLRVDDDGAWCAECGREAGCDVGYKLRG